MQEPLHSKRRKMSSWCLRRAKPQACIVQCPEKTSQLERAPVPSKEQKRGEQPDSPAFWDTVQRSHFSSTSPRLAKLRYTEMSKNEEEKAGLLIVAMRQDELWFTETCFADKRQISPPKKEPMASTAVTNALRVVSLLSRRYSFLLADSW